MLQDYCPSIVLPKSPLWFSDQWRTELLQNKWIQQTKDSLQPEEGSGSDLCYVNSDIYKHVPTFINETLERI